MGFFGEGRVNRSATVFPVGCGRFPPVPLLPHMGQCFLEIARRCSERSARRCSESSARARLAGDTARAATSDEVKDLRREASVLKEVVAELTSKIVCSKKRDGGWGGCRMRYSASEKLEIIRLVEESALPVRRTLEKIGIPRATFYRWYDLYRGRKPWTTDFLSRIASGTAFPRIFASASLDWR
jgi:transposase-like protein